MTTGPSSSSTAHATPSGSRPPTGSPSARRCRYMDPTAPPARSVVPIIRSWDTPEAWSSTGRAHADWRAASCGAGSKEAGALPAAGAQALCVVLALLVAREALLRTAARVRALLHRAGALRRRRRARRGEALVVPLAFDGIRRVTPVHALGVPVVVLVAMEAGGDATTRRAALLPVLGALRSRGQLGAIPPCAVSPNLIDT